MSLWPSFHASSAPWFGASVLRSSGSHVDAGFQLTAGSRAQRGHPPGVSPRPERAAGPAAGTGPAPRRAALPEPAAAQRRDLQAPLRVGRRDAPDTGAPGAPALGPLRPSAPGVPVPPSPQLSLADPPPPPGRRGRGLSRAGPSS